MVPPQIHPSPTEPTGLVSKSFDTHGDTGCTFGIHHLANSCSFSLIFSMYQSKFAIGNFHCDIFIVIFLSVIVLLDTVSPGTFSKRLV